MRRCQSKVSKTILKKSSEALTNLFASDGDTRAVAIIALGKATILQTDYDNWDGGQTGFTVYIEIPQNLYHQLEGKHGEIEETFKEKAKEIVRLYEREWIAGFVITTELVEDPHWRKAKSWVAGQGISNQGRARSDNLAPRSADGLLFRSQPEIYLYRAFKSLGISYCAPACVCTWWRNL